MRYAVYVTPPADDPLSEAAARWLGRSPWPGARQPVGAADDALVAAPRRYGFHGTMKAPFRLRDGAGEADLVAAFHAFCSRQEAVTIDRLVLGQLGPFFALVPDGDSTAINALADACVRDFEPFRAALTEGEIARRHPDTLSVAERDNLLRWGYPYVFAQFRFHMTLTGPVADQASPVVRRDLLAHFSDHLDRPLAFGMLALFAEPEPGAPFHVIAHALLSGHAAKESR